MRSYPPGRLLLRPATAQEVDDRHDATRVHEYQGGCPRCFRASNVRARSPGEIDERGDLQPRLERGGQQHALSKARIQLIPASVAHRAIVRRCVDAGKADRSAAPP
jgi:hypothetical protein